MRRKCACASFVMHVHKLASYGHTPCFPYTSAPIKATEMVFIWKNRGDLFRYKTISERFMGAEMLAKWFGASIS